jgi:hypothetical protein
VGSRQILYVDSRQILYVGSREITIHIKSK